jgi:hypothetical protein
METLKDKIIEIIKVHHDFNGPYGDCELAEKILDVISKKRAKISPFTPVTGYLWRRYVCLTALF